MEKLDLSPVLKGIDKKWEYLTLRRNKLISQLEKIDFDRQLKVRTI